MYHQIDLGNASDRPGDLSDTTSRLNLFKSHEVSGSGRDVGVEAVHASSGAEITIGKTVFNIYKPPCKICNR